MAGVIDKFTFMLMLDAQNFKKGGDTALGVIGGIKNTFLKTSALLAGVDLFKNMLNTYTSAAKSIDNFNVLTGENITELQAWQKAIQDTDGDIGAFQGTVKKLVDMQAQLQLTGTTSDQFAYIRRFVGIDPMNMKGLDILKQIGKYLNTVKNEAKAFKEAQLMGIDESTFIMLRRYGDRFDKVIKANEKYAYINQQAIRDTREYNRIVSDFKTSWLHLSSAIMKEVLPVFTKELFPALEKVLKFIEKKKIVEKWGKALGWTLNTSLEGLEFLSDGISTVSGAVSERLKKEIKDMSLGKLGLPSLIGPLTNLNTPSASSVSGVNDNKVFNISKMTVVANDPKQFMEETSKLNRGDRGFLSNSNILDVFQLSEAHN